MWNEWDDRAEPAIRVDPQSHSVYGAGAVAAELEVERPRPEDKAVDLEKSHAPPATDPEKDDE
jgi:hypothetical protein